MKSNFAAGAIGSLVLALASMWLGVYVDSPAASFAAGMQAMIFGSFCIGFVAAAAEAA